MTGRIPQMTKKLIKYFTSLITAVILMTMVISSLFLSKIYSNIQYKNMEDASIKIYNDLKAKNSTGTKDYGNIFNAVIINNNNVQILTSNKMGMMPFIRSIEQGEIKDKGIFINPSNEEFLYYRYKTDLGDIIVLSQRVFSSNFIRDTIIILSIVFVLAAAASLLLIYIAGNKLTMPLLKLQKASKQLAGGDYNADFKVKTNDEIEDLSKSLIIMANSLKEKDSMQKKFIANVSHDFKTPLSVIRNYSEAIKDGLVEGENLKNYSMEIIEEVDRLNYMVINLLELSKLQEGNYKLKEEYFSINDLFSKSISSYKKEADKRNINIIVETTDCKIYGDYRYLRRVIDNFLENAIKFSNDGGAVKISAIQSDNGLKVSVRDYGAGIDKEEINNVWNRYYKNNKSGGMGLGLAICKEILEKHGFSYGVNSRKGEGAEFYFAIPDKNINF
jgi:signal transduction histidine kinase